MYINIHQIHRQILKFLILIWSLYTFPTGQFQLLQMCILYLLPHMQKKDFVGFFFYIIIKQLNCLLMLLKIPESKVQER